MFRNREEAARLLAQRLKGRKLHDPLVLAIPRGGVVIGAVLARELDAELDVVFARKLRASDHPMLTVGAIAEYGPAYLTQLTQHAHEVFGLTELYLAQERRHQLDEIAWRKELYRNVRPPASIKGRSVILTDDGIATGSSMIAALKEVDAKWPHELIVAVPVAPPDRLAEVHCHCDEVICLLTPDFLSIGQFYEDFPPVKSAEAVELLRASVPCASGEVHLEGGVTARDDSPDGTDDPAWEITPCPASPSTTHAGTPSSTTSAR
jgi:putative phosphoribosyl transferase